MTIPCAHDDPNQMTLADCDLRDRANKEIILQFILCGRCKQAIPRNPEQLRMITPQRLEELQIYFLEKRGYRLDFNSLLSFTYIFNNEEVHHVQL
jgi:hypothetical protein